MQIQTQWFTVQTASSRVPAVAHIIHMRKLQWRHENVCSCWKTERTQLNNPEYRTALSQKCSQQCVTHEGRIVVCLCQCSCFGWFAFVSLFVSVCVLWWCVCIMNYRSLKVSVAIWWLPFWKVKEQRGADTKVKRSVKRACAQEDEIKMISK